MFSRTLKTYLYHRNSTLMIWFCRTALDEWVELVTKWGWLNMARMKMDYTSKQFQNIVVSCESLKLCSLSNNMLLCFLLRVPIIRSENQSSQNTKRKRVQNQTENGSVKMCGCHFHYWLFHKQFVFWAPVEPLQCTKFEWLGWMQVAAQGTGAMFGNLRWSNSMSWPLGN